MLQTLGSSPLRDSNSYTVRGAVSERSDRGSSSRRRPQPRSHPAAQFSLFSGDDDRKMAIKT